MKKSGRCVPLALGLSILHLRKLETKTAPELQLKVCLFFLFFFTGTEEFLNLIKASDSHKLMKHNNTPRFHHAEIYAMIVLV